MEFHEIGGALTLLALSHLIADWLLQTEASAKRKPGESPWTLALHSCAYALAMSPALAISMQSWQLAASAALALAVSHGAIDTWAPVWMWARIVRRPKEMRGRAAEGFVEWTSKPGGMALAMTADQAMHLAFLAPMAAMAAMAKENESAARQIGWWTMGAALALAGASVAALLWMWRKPKNEEEDWDGGRPPMPSQHD